MTLSEFKKQTTVTLDPYHVLLDTVMYRPILISKNIKVIADRVGISYDALESADASSLIHSIKDTVKEKVYYAIESNELKKYTDDTYIL